MFITRFSFTASSSPVIEDTFSIDWGIFLVIAIIYFILILPFLFPPRSKDQWEAMQEEYDELMNTD